MYKRVNELLGTEYKSNSDINWGKISSRKLSEDFIREFENYLNWSVISSCQILSESFIKEFKNKVKWFNVQYCQKLSEEFIEENINLIDFEIISNRQILSEEFFFRYSEKVNWLNILYHQPFINFERCKEIVKKKYPNMNELMFEKIKRTNFLNPLYQSNKEWFLCYCLNNVEQKPRVSLINISAIYSFKISLRKIKVYWKDLLVVDEIINNNLKIREFKYIK